MNNYFALSGYFSLSLASFLHGAGLPAPAEVLLLAVSTLAKQEYISLWPGVLLVSAANALGVVVPYLAGKTVGMAFAAKTAARQNRYEILTARLRRYGAWVIVFTRIIGIMRYACLLLAGSCGIPYYKVALATFIGTFIYTVGGLMVLQLGWAALSRAGYGVMPLLLATLLAFWLYRRYRKLKMH